MTDTDVVCEDCGRVYKCRRCRPPRNPWTGRFQKTHPDGPHDTAARVQGWTVWRENGGQGRTTILCPKHRAERGIQARVVPLGDAS
jgi:hypothetical protein